MGKKLRVPLFPMIDSLLFYSDNHNLFLKQKQAQLNQMMILKELMLQKKKQMTKSIHSLILAIFYHLALSKVTDLNSGDHLSLQMTEFMGLTQKMTLTPPLNPWALIFLMLNGARSCQILSKRRRVSVSGQ